MPNVRIGIVCEGPTDTVVIKVACERYLAELGWQANVFPIQPLRDSTLGEQGGWTMVRTWLLSNNHESRCLRHFGLGLFANGLDALQCDIIFIHLDSDIIKDAAFNEGAPPVMRSPVTDREYVVRKLADWIGRDNFTDADQHRYVSGVAVQSIETWCLALFKVNAGSIESIDGDQLGKAFNLALLASEGIQKADVASVPNKDRNRRARFVDTQSTKAGLQRAMDQSPSFNCAFAALKQSVEFLRPILGASAAP
jgi:hypothetical protein